jgi:predicted CXXCH cytochrome family protein
MQAATAQTVLGNFDNARFTYGGVTSSFFRRGDKFVVKTDGPDGKLHEYEVRYTFGVEPLQQYLIELPGGRLQALSIAWDVRAKKWFHLYPKERITHADELHWTAGSQNWNFMCADCHSTAVRKNYDEKTKRFHTEWSEVSVGCEACHGPGVAHIAWAKARPAKTAGTSDNDKGLSVQLDERRGIEWKLDPATGMPSRSKPRDTEREIQVCAQCHARRGQIAEGYSAGKPFLDYYLPALLGSPNYYVDGQQREEVYDWGSFLQSKMYARGVTCSDCHEPHSGKTLAEGNNLCTRCHTAVKYDAPSHHHHPAGSKGAQCTACHMPTATYMIIDPRHDHSLRVPRPDLSVELGTPNACNSCHSDRDARWAAAQVKAWYGRNAEGFQNFAGAFHAAEVGAVAARQRLRTIAGDTATPAIARGTALAAMNTAAGRASRDAVANGLSDADPLVRLGALRALAHAPPELRAQLAPPLLSDPLRAIRIEAVGVLAAVPQSQLNNEQRAAFDRAAREYVDTQRYNADRAEAHLNLGSFYAQRGEPVKAEQELKAAIELNPWFVPAYVNLADVYRMLGREADAERTLRQGLKRSPNSASLHHTLGLSLVRAKRTDAAVTEFARAAKLEPGNARFAYVYAVALYSSGHAPQAIALLTKANAAHPDDTDILQALAGWYRERGEGEKAKPYMERLRTLAASED